jgi:aryl-alcohol dehydrogenase-like predicted oxidoreductase
MTEPSPRDAVLERAAEAIFQTYEAGGTGIVPHSAIARAVLASLADSRDALIEAVRRQACPFEHEPAACHLEMAERTQTIDTILSYLPGEGGS